MGVFSDIYRAYDENVWGGLLPGGQPFGESANQPVYQAPNFVDVGGSTGVTSTPQTTQGAQPVANSCGVGCDAPRYMTYDCKTGELKPRRRRRRKAMLTKSDIADLAFIATLPTNANVKSSLAARISRS